MLPIRAPTGSIMGEIVQPSQQAPEAKLPLPIYEFSARDYPE